MIFRLTLPLLWIALVVLTLQPETLALGWGRGKNASPAPRTLITTSAGPEQLHTLTMGTSERRYWTVIPPAVAKSTRRVPMVLVLHGGGGNGLNAAMMTGFSQKALQEEFIVVYPEGSGALRDKLLTWNAGHCCGSAMRNKVNDVAFIRSLINTMVDQYPVDPKRVYVTGMSNGGMMTHRLGIHLADQVAAIAPVVSGLFGDEQITHIPVPAIIFNGAKDVSVPSEGGNSKGRAASAWDGKPLKSAEYQGVYWATVNGCRMSTQKVSVNPQVCLWRYNCPDGREVERYLVLDGGHAWPGGQRGSRNGDVPSGSLNATDTMWQFFKEHSK